MSMQPSFSSSDWNPFSALARKIGKIGGPQSETEARAMEMHKAQYAAHQYGMEAEAQKAGLQEQAEQAHHGRRAEFVTSILKHAKHETPIHINFGDVSVQFTKKAKKTKTPQPQPPKPPKITPRDPKTGQAMKAPE